MEYSKENPFLAHVTERYVLNAPGSKKATYHLVLSLKDSGIHYKVGDCIGVYCANGDGVEKTIKAIGASGDETVTLQRTGKQLTLREALTSQFSVTKFSKKLVQLIASKQRDDAKRQQLETLLAREGREVLKRYMDEHEVWDTIAEQGELVISPQELCDVLMPLLPRLYSISSSEKAVGDEVHLTIGHVSYQTNGHERLGVCSDYLGQKVELNQASVPIYLHASEQFSLPDNPEASLIMVGPGTGVAPFRAFMQERVARSDQGRNWLFFGDWNRSTDFYYEDFWLEQEQAGHLQLDLAFSRDQEQKVYVQHRMLEKAAQIWQWLQEGAYFFVCGDAKRMAKDVDATLLQIVQEQGSMDITAAKDYLKTLKKERRYQRDVY